MKEIYVINLMDHYKAVDKETFDKKLKEEYHSNVSIKHNFAGVDEITINLVFLDLSRSDHGCLKATQAFVQYIESLTGIRIVIPSVE